jgi:hypothetical protein
MTNPRTSEEMFAIANKYALAKEVTLDTREQQKKKESGHTDQPSSSKGRGRWIILSTMRSRRDTIRSTGPHRVNLKAS